MEQGGCRRDGEVTGGGGTLGWMVVRLTVMDERGKDDEDRERDVRRVNSREKE